MPPLLELCFGSPGSGVRWLGGISESDISFCRYACGMMTGVTLPVQPGVGPLA